MRDRTQLLASLFLSKILPPCLNFTVQRLPIQMALLAVQRIYPRQGYVFHMHSLGQGPMSYRRSLDMGRSFRGTVPSTRPCLYHCIIIIIIKLIISNSEFHTVGAATAPTVWVPTFIFTRTMLDRDCLGFLAGVSIKIIYVGCVDGSA